ncbi:MAG: coiled-coil domain-containing protein [Coprobacillus cateniformis]
MSRQKKIFIGFFTLCLMTAFSLSYISVQAEDFKGQEEKYIKLCSSSKLTDKQQKTCQEFNTYLKDKNKELAKDTKETQKNVKNTENTIQDIIKQMTDLEAKAASTQKELKYIQDSIESYNKNITKKQKTLEERMYAMQTTMNSGIYVSYLLGAEDFTDFMSRAANFKELTQYDNDIIEELTNAMKEVQKQQDTLKILKESIEQDKLAQAELKEKFTAKLKEQNKELAANNAEVS